MKLKNFKADFKEYYLKNNDLKEFAYHDFLNLPLAYTFNIYMDFFALSHINIQIVQKDDKFYRVTLTWSEKDLLGKGIIKNSLKEAREEGFQIAKSYYSSLQNFDGFEVCEY